MKDLSRFLNEGKTEDEKPAPLKEGEGADDKTYLLLMGEYKKQRRKDPEGSLKLLDKAQKILETGDVSPNAKLAAAYL